MQHDFILLDRSGSMSTLWVEALSSVNAYVKKLAEDHVDTGVTLVAFDDFNGLSFDVLRDRIIPTTWDPVTDKDAGPRGGTPLNDAIGRLVGLANSGGYDKVAIIVMTDGHENASREISGSQAKALLDECRSKGWQVIFLGANFDNAAQAQVLGNSKRSTIATSAANLCATMAATASLRSTYAKTGANMEYSDEQKARLSR